MAIKQNVKHTCGHDYAHNMQGLSYTRRDSFTSFLECQICPCCMTDSVTKKEIKHTTPTASKFCVFRHKQSLLTTPAPGNPAGGF